MIRILVITVMNVSGINLNLLVVLDALLAERNVTRAGRRLGLTQPAVSNALAQLRALFGDPLLVRTSRGMAPTERAASLAAPVRDALAAVERALTPAVRFEPAAAERTFVICATDLVDYLMLPKLLGRLSRESPGIKLHVRSWPHHRVPPTLETGEVDLMLGFYPEVPPGHRDEPLFRDEFVCIVGKHNRAVGKRLTLQTYVKLKHVLVSQEESSPGVADTALAARGLSRTVGLRISHFLMVPAIVASSDMIAAVDSRVAKPFAKTLPLRLLPPPLPLPAGWVGQVWHERTHASPAHAWLRSVISEIGRAL